MITIQVYDYTNSSDTEGPEVRIYNETQLEEVSRESGWEVKSVEKHIANAKANGRDVIAYLTIMSWVMMVEE